MSVLKIRDENGVFRSVTTIRGEKGDKGDTGGQGPQGEKGKDGATAAEVIAAMQSETWVFTLEDGSVIEKKVLLA